MKIAVVVGSNRKASINRKLAEALVRLAGDSMQASFIRIDDLPMYNQDLEVDRPSVVHRFTGEIAAADAILMVTSEHNRSVPAVLKNAIDWGSKPTNKNVWRGKVAAITGTSPGAIGTAVGQQHLRQILGILGCIVCGGEAYVSFKPEVFTDDGAINNDDTRAFLRSYLDNFLSLAKKVNGN